MFQGSIPALITPFHQDSSIDFESLKGLIEWHIEEGSDGLVLGGSTGEHTSLTDEEWCAIVEVAVSTAKGRLKLIAATGMADTAGSVLKTQKAKKLGADGALVVLPYYVRPTEEGCFRHFEELARVGFPLILYHNPPRTGVRLSAQMTARICTLPEVVAVKEASGDLSFALELSQLTSKTLLSGDDPLTLHHRMLGFKGSIAVIGNAIPGKWREFNQFCSQEKWAEARRLFFEVVPLLRALALEPNPQGIKYAVSCLGRVSPHLRLPLILPREETRRAIEKSIEVHRSAGSASR